MTICYARMLFFGAALLAAQGCAIPAPGPPAVSRIAFGVGPDGTRTVTVPACPDWSRSSREDFSNRDGSNFGCADTVNFVRQLADPRDALHGRTGGTQDGSLATGAVERYRARKTAAFSGSGSQGGAAASAATPDGHQ